jgi:hypothetical protein
MRVARETVTLPTVWQGATVSPNTEAKQCNSGNEHEQPAVDSINAAGGVKVLQD